MKNKKPRAYIPIYAFAVAWIVCAFFIPMYTLAGLAGSAAVSAAAATLLARLVILPQRADCQTRNARDTQGYDPSTHIKTPSCLAR